MFKSKSSPPINSESCFLKQGNWGAGYSLAKSQVAGVTVGPGAENPNVFAQAFPVKAQRHFRLVARARSATDQPGKGQFQINWLGKDGTFIAASQQRFDVTAKEATAEYRVTAPNEAATGIIYVAPGGRSNVVQYFEMSLFPDFDPPPPSINEPAPRFPSNIIHLSDPITWSQFGNLFRGYDDEVIFKEMITKIIGYTMVTYDGLLGLLSMIRFCETSGLKGDFVEIGSWRGGCSGLMALGSLHYGEGRRNIRVYDSFQGLPQAIASKDFDGFLEPMFDLDEANSQGKLEPINCLVAAENDVRELLFGKFKYPEECVSIYKGWFQDTIPASKDAIDEIAILRLDGDLYDSYVVALEHLYPKVVKGGFIIIDDWVLGGCRKAVQEYFERHGLNPFVWSLDATTRCFQVA